MRIPKVIAVWSPKAGAGKSFVAANLAYEFAKNDILTCVLDFDTISPAQESFLDMKINDDTNINKAIKAVKDGQDFLGYFVQHEKYKNLFLLANGKSTSIDAGYKIEYKDYVGLINAAKEKFECVIIDSPTTYLDAGTMAALINSEKIVSVLKHDYLDVYSFLRYSSFLEKVNIVKWKHQFVLNGAFNSVLEKKKILEILKIPSILEIPLYKDPNVLNNAIAEDPNIRGAFKKIFDTVTSNIVPVRLGTEEKKKSLLSFISKGKGKSGKSPFISVKDDVIAEDKNEDLKKVNSSIVIQSSEEEIKETDNEVLAIKKIRKKYGNE
ncbi:AAA family ATPase [Caldanaerobacter subterraneus]|uniref:AAA family ATPase n=1 Tax=Caldanaerobacter subterraneus TaxID=911092 RepID=A0A7Y2L838_9THEO|nr:AAA family ATPase [Caldanaerobacter subterraneus]NNG67558.1 AAA family ATPase [Caldanaerobacter subterraneus]